MKNIKSFLDIFIRYSILLIIGILGLKLFYLLFTFITVYTVYFFLNLFFDATLISDVILINNLPIEIIGPCVAGSAYYLLLILNLSIPEIKFSNRIKILFFSFLILFIINILRIILLSVLLIFGLSFFDMTHKLFWYGGSTIFVVGIWFLSIKIFKIKKIPFYSDVKFLLKNLRKKTKKTKRSKKH